MSPRAAVARVCSLAAALEDRRMPALEQVDQLTEVMQAADHARTLIVQQMRARSEASWAQIGAAMGVTKQAAHERFAPKPPAEDPQPSDPLF